MSTFITFMFGFWIVILLVLLVELVDWNEVDVSSWKGLKKILNSIGSRVIFVLVLIFLTFLGSFLFSFLEADFNLKKQLLMNVFIGISLALAPEIWKELTDVVL